MKFFLFYIGTFVVSSSIAKLYDSFCKKRKKIKWYMKAGWFLSIILLPTVLSCCRYAVGTDYRNYERMFNLYLQSGQEQFLLYFSTTGVGHLIFIKLGQLLFGTAQGIFCIYSIATIFLLTLSVLYFRDRIPIFVGMMIMYILYYPASYNTIRQIMAVSIILYSLRFIEKKRLDRFLLCIILASSFHVTSIVACIIYFIYNGKGQYSRLRESFLCFVCILVPFIIILLFSIGSYLPLVGYLFNNYSISLNQKYRIDFIIRIILYLPWINSYFRDIKRDSRNKIYYYMLLMDFEFILVSFFFEWAYRLTYFTEFAQIILIGSRITLSSTRNEKALKELYYLGVYLVMFILFYCFWKRDNIVPYVSIFSQNIKIWK